MVQISKRKLSDKTLSKLFLLLFHTVGKKNKQEQFEKIINDLFSDTERIMIIKRVAIIYLLLKEIDQKTITDVLKVSSSTVSKYSITAKRGEGIVSFFKRLLQKEKFVEFFDDVFYELFARPGIYGINWERAWQSKAKRERLEQQGI